MYTVIADYHVVSHENWEMLAKNYLKSMSPSPFLSHDPRISSITYVLRPWLLSIVKLCATCECLLEFLGRDYSIPITVQSLEHIDQVFLLKNHRVLHAAGNEFCVVYFSIMVCVYEVHQLFDLLHSCSLFLLIQARFQFLCCDKSIMVNVYLFE